MSETAHPLIVTRDLRLAPGSGEALAFPDFEINAAAQCLLHGPSGSGKTSLLHLICGLRLPSAGSLWVDGIEPASLSPAARDRWRGRRIGLVLQQPHLLPGLSVADNLAAARYCAGLPADRGRIQRVLGALGIAALAVRRPDSLSQGQAQRVAVARAVLNEPALLLADEPTASLDDSNAEAVADLLAEHASDMGAALVVATHDRRLMSRFTQRVALDAAPEFAARELSA